MPEKIILVAMTANRVIGRKGELPWSLPEELDLFRRLTIGNVVVMGRRTFLSLDGPLTGRHNIVVSSTLDSGRGVLVCRSFAEAVSEAERFDKKIFFIGGQEIYRLALPIADSLAVSWVEGEFSGDVLFPAVNFSQWKAVSETQFRGFCHILYRRRSGPENREEQRR